MYLSGVEIVYFGKAHLGKAHLDLFNRVIDYLTKAPLKYDFVRGFYKGI